MERRKIESREAPRALGPYSQAIAVQGGTLVLASGQIGIDPRTGDLVGGGVVAETEQAIRNLRAVLDAAAPGKALVIKTTVYLRHFEDFAAMNEAYGRLMKEPYPARACVGVAALPKGALVEIEAIAVIED